VLAKLSAGIATVVTKILLVALERAGGFVELLPPLPGGINFPSDWDAS
jgi:hypothetical protein